MGPLLHANTGQIWLGSSDIWNGASAGYGKGTLDWSKEAGYGFNKNYITKRSGKVQTEHLKAFLEI